MKASEATFLRCSLNLKKELDAALKHNSGLRYAASTQATYKTQ